MYKWALHLVTQVDTNIILFWHSMNKDWTTLVSMTCVTKWKTSKI